MTAASKTPRRRQRRRPQTNLIALAAATVIVLFLRRPDQFLHPYIWIEDGYVTLKSFAEHGVGILTEPVNGQYLFASKLLSYIAFRTSVPWTPEIQVVLAALLTCAVVLAVALSPTHLPWPFLCALGTLLVPLGPEVFAVSAYGSWWAGLLLLLVPLWRSKQQGLRWFCLLLGGLSSPIIVPIACIQALRAVCDRDRVEWMTTAICALIAIVQIATLWNSPILASLQAPTVVGVAADVVRFVGSFFVGRKGGYFVTGAIALVALASVAVMVRDRLDRYFVLTLAMFVGACMASTARLQISMIHQFLGGPRYFFYPFVLITWVGIWLAAKSSRRICFAMLVVYLVAIAIAAPGMSWRHNAIDWRAHLAICASSDGLSIPVLWWNGSPSEIHWVHFLGQQCKAFIDQSLFAMPSATSQSLPTPQPPNQ